MKLSTTIKIRQEQKYIDYGVELGWLIDPDRREVKIYTSTGISAVTGVSKLRAADPVKGLLLICGPSGSVCMMSPSRAVLSNQMQRVDLYIKIEVELDEDENPERVAAEICRQIEKIYVVRAAELSSTITR